MVHKANCRAHVWCFVGGLHHRSVQRPLYSAVPCGRLASRVRHLGVRLCDNTLRHLQLHRHHRPPHCRGAVHEAEQNLPGIEWFGGLCVAMKEPDMFPALGM